MRTRLSIRALVASCAFAMLLPGCGSSPTAPSAAFSVAGAWTGTWQFVTSGITVTDTVTATITQGGSTATGSWTAASGASGNFNFTVASSIAGTWTILQNTLTGTACTASTSFSGTASSSAIDFSVGTLTPSGVCQWATGNQFSLKK